MAQLDTLLSGSSIHNPAQEELTSGVLGTDSNRVQLPDPGHDLQYYSARHKRYGLDKWLYTGWYGAG